MMRLKESWSDEPGRNTHLSKDSIESEDDWHESFKQRMESAGWYLKHEVTANNSDNRVDFLGFHSDLNRSFDEGEWVGFELKYSDYDKRTRATSAASQI